VHPPQYAKSHFLIQVAPCFAHHHLHAPHPVNVAPVSLMEQAVAETLPEKPCSASHPTLVIVGLEQSSELQSAIAASEPYVYPKGIDVGKVHGSEHPVNVTSLSDVEQPVMLTLPEKPLDESQDTSAKFGLEQSAAEHDPLTSVGESPYVYPVGGVMGKVHSVGSHPDNATSLSDQEQIQVSMVPEKPVAHDTPVRDGVVQSVVIQSASAFDEVKLYPSGTVLGKVHVLTGRHKSGCSQSNCESGVFVL